MGSGNSKPVVSIITPLYNSEHCFPATAESVLAQTFTNFEWIIVNDCSTDGTGEMLDALARRDGRVHVVHLSQNQGPIFARNCAMGAAAGRFIAFIDGDDLWLPEKLEKQVSYMLSSGAHMTYTSFRKISSNGSGKLSPLIKAPPRAPYDRILRSDYMMASSVVFDTEVTGRILQSDEAPIGKDDFHFFLQILKKHGPAHGLGDDLCRLRISGDSVTGAKLKSAWLQWYFYRRVIGLSFASSLGHFVVYAVKGLYKYLR